jgi:predicted acylesterase/phospholipase RssA
VGEAEADLNGACSDHESNIPRSGLYEPNETQVSSVKPEGTMLVPTRVAFQGGGARLADLLPIVAAIQKAKLAKEIAVTHVSGTSAGAIAAGLVATNTDARQFINQLTGERKGVIPGLLGKGRMTGWLTTSKAGLLTSLLAGRSISNKKRLRHTIHKLFTQSNPRLSADFKLKHLPVIGFSVMVTDITSCQPQRISKTLDPDKNLFDVVADSCSVPFLFKYLPDLKLDPPDFYVDGGIVQNFPIDSLVDDKNLVSDMILGFGFTDDFKGSPINGILAYSSRLLSSSMQSSMEYAKRKVGPDRVFQIKSTLDTFDFAEALDQILDADHFERRVDEAYEWILTKVGTYRTSYERVTLSHVLCRVKEVYATYVTDEMAQNRSDLLRIVKIDSMFPPESDLNSANDRSYTSYNVAFDDRRMNAIRVANPLDNVDYEFNDALAAIPEPRITLEEAGTSLSFTSVPSRGITREKSLDHLVFFKGTTGERRAVSVGQRAYIYRGLTGLHPDNGSQDYFIIRNQGIDPIEGVKILFYVPRRIERRAGPDLEEITLSRDDVFLSIRNGVARADELAAGPGEALNLAEITALNLPREENDERFLKVGWSIQALPPKSAFGLDLSLPKYLTVQKGA